MLEILIEHAAHGLRHIFVDDPSVRHQLLEELEQTASDELVERCISSGARHEKFSKEESDQAFVDIFCIDSKPAGAAEFSAFAAVAIMITIVVAAIVTRSFSISVASVCDWLAFGVGMFLQFFSAWWSLHAGRLAIRKIPLNLRGWVCLIVWLSGGAASNLLWFMLVLRVIGYWLFGRVFDPGISYF